MARQCDNLIGPSTCACSFIAASGETITGTGSALDPFVIPTCQNPVLTVVDCFENEIAINCGDIVLVHPSGFAGGPDVTIPTISDGILYIPRTGGDSGLFSTTTILGTLGGTQLIQDLEDPGGGLLVDAFKVDLTAMITTSVTLCQQTPAPPPVAGECVGVSVGARVQNGVQVNILSGVQSIWSPPNDVNSKQCMTLTSFNTITLGEGVSEINPRIVLNTLDCPTDPDRIFEVISSSATIQY